MKTNESGIFYYEGMTYQRQESLDLSNNGLSRCQTPKRQSEHATNKLFLNATFTEDESNTSQIIASQAIRDDVDTALLKCIHEQQCFKNMTIKKVGKCLYKIDNKEYKLRLLTGNNLAIKMYAGYVFTDCLVHFDEELHQIVAN